MCSKHPNQELSHYVEETKEIICVYCAFEKYKDNKHQDIKEIKTKAKELLTEINKFITEDQNFIEQLQKAVDQSKNNQSQEEEKVIKQFDAYAKILEEKKNEILSTIGKHASSNKEKISNKLAIITKKMEETEQLKSILTENDNGERMQLQTIIKSYSEISKKHAEQKNSFVDLLDYKFSYDESNKFLRYMNSVADLQTKTKQINPGLNIQKSQSRDLFSSFEPNKK